jgi:hypothetical protein
LQPQYNESVIVQNSNFPKKPKLTPSTSYNHPYLGETHFPVRQDIKIVDARMDPTRFQPDLSMTTQKPAVVLPNTQPSYRPLDKNGAVSLINDSPESKGIPSPTNSSSHLLSHHSLLLQSPSKANFPPPPAHAPYRAPQISTMSANDCTQKVDCPPKESLPQPIFGFSQDLSFQTQPLDLGVASNRKIESTDKSKSHESLTEMPKEIVTRPASDHFEEKSNIEVNDDIKPIFSTLNDNKVLDSQENFESNEEKIDVKETDAIVKGIYYLLENCSSWKFLFLFTFVAAPRHLKKAWLQRHTVEDVDTSVIVAPMQEIKTETLSYNDNSSELGIENETPTQDEGKVVAFELI